MEAPIIISKNMLILEYGSGFPIVLVSVWDPCVCKFHLLTVGCEQELWSVHEKMHVGGRKVAHFLKIIIINYHNYIFI